MGVELYHENYFQNSKIFQKNKYRTKSFINFIKSYEVKSVLDVGCGIGTLVWKLNRFGIRAMGVDFAPILKEKFWKGPYFVCADAKNMPFPDKSFDMVFSSDFFEHIEEKDIDKVAVEMKRIGRIVVAVVAHDLGGKVTPGQRQYHVTHKTLEWWINRLPDIQVFSAHDYPNLCNPNA